MITYRWETVNAKKAKIHRFVKNALGDVEQHTVVKIAWTHPVPDSESYIEKLFFHYGN